MKKHFCNYKLYAVGLFTGLVNGLIGSGGGTIIVPFLKYLIDIEPHKAHATAIAIIFPLSIISTFIYFKNGFIDLKTGLLVALGSIVGGYIGAKLLNKIPKKLLRKTFGGFMIIVSVRMLIKCFCSS
ncbi:sulfite exporter TauE/SafE family protein [Abyssisolibacter fermentans]|uniref:sulfite exporter TauE/SafE family protein n=1 Tax=Abyssisolibacter fermentans TaxID=1766203 RepID=UPI000832BA40|nr:sulfite exporter TauE/SafE family protein [Abyssisolibacter fermentans]